VRDPVARFWSKVDKSAGPDACWLWTASRDKNGYGLEWWGKRTQRAHRIAWMIVNGPIPKGEGHHGTCVCHTCDVPACCNPSHMWLGSNAENHADRDRKGRGRGTHLRGNANGSAKLTEADIPRIFDAHSSGETSSAIARRFGVGRTAIAEVLCGHTWHHVSGVTRT
jgi:hypothetical protein